MEIEKAKSFFSNLKEKLEKQLSNSVKKNESTAKELITKELVEIEKRNEKKIKNLYYLLFGTFCVLLLIIIGMFFYLSNNR